LATAVADLALISSTLQAKCIVWPAAKKVNTDWPAAASSIKPVVANSQAAARAAGRNVASITGRLGPATRATATD